MRACLLVLRANQSLTFSSLLLLSRRRLVGVLTSEQSTTAPLTAVRLTKEVSNTTYNFVKQAVFPAFGQRLDFAPPSDFQRITPSPE